MKHVKPVALACLAACLAVACHSQPRELEDAGEPDAPAPEAVAGEAPDAPEEAPQEPVPELSDPYPTPAPPVRFEADPGWVAEKPSSSMRLAQWSMPAAGSGGEDDASLVIFFFGTGSGGSVEQNLERWEEQIESAEGAEPERSEREANGFRFHTVDTSGRYVAAVFPGSDDTFDEPGWRLVATVIEGGRGPFYAKLVGPAATVERWRSSYDALLDSFRP